MKLSSPANVPRFCARLPGLVAATLWTMFIALAAAGGAHAGSPDDTASSNVYLAGAEVRIDRPVDGDLVVAAGRIHIDQPIAGDAVVGAGSIDVQSSVGDDLRAAGAIITLGARVGHDVLLAAGRIITTAAADVQGETWLAAATVTLGGRFASPVRIFARDITIDGETFGPVDLAAERITIGERARIRGDLTYSSDEEIKIHPLARIEGKVTREPRRLEANQPTRTLPGLKPLRPLVLAAVLALGMLVLALFPRLTASAVRTLSAAPGKSLGLGIALLFSVPPIAVLLVITIIGIPVALALILAQILAVMCGYVVTAMVVAHGLGRTVGKHAIAGWQQYAFLGLAIVVLALVTSIPYVGVFVLLLACSAGLGAIVLQRFSRRTVRGSGGTDAWPAA